jgi:hypothetical protein
MSRDSHSFPDADTLTQGLARIFGKRGTSIGRPRVIARHRTLYASSFPCEIVTCQLGESSRIRLFCKYEAGDTEPSHGLRRGVPYEAEVYRRVLQPAGMSTPTFFGTYTDPATRRFWLVLEHVNESCRLAKVSDPTAMKQAARWIGRFHARSTSAVNGRRAFLTRFDRDYYRGWASRTARFARVWRAEFPLVSHLCKSLETVLPSLAAQPQTVVHGEYYSHNILFQKGVIRPVDWETAAAAPGEVDLASLTEGWPKSIVGQCEVEYQRARWPKGAPGSFARTIDLARLYVHLRWLGDQLEWTFGEKWRFREMLVIGKRLGLL